MSAHCLQLSRILHPFNQRVVHVRRSSSLQVASDGWTVVDAGERYVRVSSALDTGVDDLVDQLQSCTALK